MREVKLPSGAALKITPAPFTEARALYQAVMEEVRTLKLDAQADIDANFYKDMLCVGLASKKIEACLWKCFERCTFNDGSGDLKITVDTFEPIERRDDYIQVCYEVAQDNIRPFMKNLFAQYKNVIATVEGALASRFQTTPSSST